jgi:broad specificity phosphatase PhoE
LTPHRATFLQTAPRAIGPVVRHGESAGNLARDRAHAAGIARIDITERDVDVPLSPRGREQSAALGAWFAGLGSDRRPEVVLVSPYQRAIATAEIIREFCAADNEIPLVIDERLREKKFGILDRLTRRPVGCAVGARGGTTARLPLGRLHPCQGGRDIE